MSNKPLIITILVSALIIAGAGFFTPIIINSPLGATPGGDFYNPVRTYVGLIISGAATSSLTGGNFVAGNTTSTGIVMRTDTLDRCYLLHLLSSGVLATSSASCN